MFPLIFTLAVLAQDAAAAPDAPVDVPQVRETVDKSLAFLAEKGLAWETTKCVSCHHGPWMMWSGYEAKKRGFVVNDEERNIQNGQQPGVVVELKPLPQKPQKRRTPLPAGAWPGLYQILCRDGPGDPRGPCPVR